MAVALILISLVVIIIATWYVRYFQYEKYLKKYGGPRPLPLLGNALDVSSPSEILWTFMEFTEKYGKVVKSYLGFEPPGLLISDIKFLETILGSTKILEKSQDYEYLHSWLGSGLLTSGSEKWRRHRKMLTPAFHFQILEQFIDVFNFYGDILIEKLEKVTGKSSIDIYPYVTLCSLDIICATSMGTNVNAQNDADSDYVYSVKEMCRIVIERITSAIKSSHLLYILTNDYQIEKKALKILHNYTNNVISSRKAELEKNKGQEDAHTDDVGIKKRKTFLDLMLQHKMEGNALSDVDIREEVDTFMFEGHDTTSSGITFALYCLANHPDIQKKVVEELEQIFDNDNTRQATHRDLQEMKYLELVIKEALRLYPPVPMYGRNVHEDIEYDGEIIPKGVTLTVFAFAVHRSADIYPNPEKFDPERFTAENQNKRSPYAYIPFSAGPRNCIGQKYAMLEMKSLISKVLRNFELLPPIPQHTPQLVGETILKSKNGVRLQLRKRNL